MSNTKNEPFRALLDEADPKAARRRKKKKKAKKPLLPELVDEGVVDDAPAVKKKRKKKATKKKSKKSPSTRKTRSADTDVPFDEEATDPFLPKGGKAPRPVASLLPELPEEGEAENTTRNIRQRAPAPDADVGDGDVPTREYDIESETRVHTYGDTDLRQMVRPQANTTPVASKTKAPRNARKRPPALKRNEDPFVHEESGPHPYKGMVRKPDDDPTLRLSTIEALPNLPDHDSPALLAADDPFARAADLANLYDDDELPVAVGTPTCHWSLDDKGRPSLVGVELEPGAPLMTLSDFARDHLAKTGAREIADAIEEALTSSSSTTWMAPPVTNPATLDRADATGEHDMGNAISISGFAPALPSDEPLEEGSGPRERTLTLSLSESLSHLAALQSSLSEEAEEEELSFSVSVSPKEPPRIPRPREGGQVLRAHDLYLSAMDLYDEGRAREALVNIKLAIAYDGQETGYHQWSTFLTFALNA